MCLLYVPATFMLESIVVNPLQHALQQVDPKVASRPLHILSLGTSSWSLKSTNRCVHAFTPVYSCRFDCFRTHRVMAARVVIVSTAGRCVIQRPRVLVLPTKCRRGLLSVSKEPAAAVLLCLQLATCNPYPTSDHIRVADQNQ